MHSHTLRTLCVILSLIAAAPRHGLAAGTKLQARQGPFAELSAGPLLGIDPALKGCSIDLSVGLDIAPFELGLRPGISYDAAMESGAFRLDGELGLGGGLRFLVGGLLPFGRIGLPDPTGSSEARIPLEAAAWPDRFGFSATIADLPWPALGTRIGIVAELVYTAYRLRTASPLAGTAAFAAAIEGRLALRLRWDFSAPSRVPTAGRAPSP